MKPTPLRLLILVSLAACLICATPFYYSMQSVIEPTQTTSASGYRTPLDYDFKLINQTVHVHPNKDASVLINYTILFENYGTEFDYIDIGFPNEYYQLSSVRAYWALEGDSFTQLTNIAHSSVISIGVEIYVPPALRPDYGERGTLIVWGTNPHMIYRDTVNEGYVGYEFAPTWFDPDYCRSTDWLSIHLHFPTGFNNGTLAFYHGTQYTRYYWDANSLVYVWEHDTHTPQLWLHGISFPYHEDYITTYYEPEQPNPFTFILAWLDEYWWVLLLVFFFLLFACCLGCSTFARRRGVSLRKGRYLPPAVKVESLGIRRGLTVIEAAVLNEVPLSRVFTMIVFGLLRKGLITITREERGKPKFHRDEAAINSAAKGRGALHYYERLFLKAITPTGTLHKTHIQSMLKTLIKTTARKLEGYSRPDSKAYYNRLLTRAWTEMDQATTPAQPAKTLDQYAEWLLLDPDYDDRLRHYPSYYVPTWYWWWFWAAHPRPHTYTGPHPPTITTPITVTDFANGVVLGTQNFANTVVTGFQNLANQIARGFVPPPPSTRSGAFSGRSCACACACASCACACAGGGR